MRIGIFIPVASYNASKPNTPQIPAIIGTEALPVTSYVAEVKTTPSIAQQVIVEATYIVEAVIGIKRLKMIRKETEEISKAMMKLRTAKRNLAPAYVIKSPKQIIIIPINGLIAVITIYIGI